MARPRGFTVLAAAGVAFALSTLAVGQESDETLERVHRVPDLLKILVPEPGTVIADVGAGDGFFTVRIARATGAAGRVVAVDISAAALDKLRDRARRDKVSNIEAVLGATDDPHLDAGQFDAIFIHNAYHEMAAHEAMLQHIHAALKSGGRFLLVEPMHDSSRGLPRDQQVAKHDLEMRIAEQEVTAAGFEIVSRDSEFVKFTGVSGAFWLLVARRP